MSEGCDPSTSTLHGVVSASAGTPGTGGPDGPPTPAPQPRSPSGALRVTGATTTTDAVIAALAGLAAREVPGVHGLGTPTQRALEAVRQHIPGASRGGSPGVQVEVGERQAAVEVAVVAELGTSAPQVAAQVRTAVAAALRELVGLEVTEVDVEVVDVAAPAG